MKEKSSLWNIWYYNFQKSTVNHKFKIKNPCLGFLTSYLSLDVKLKDLIKIYTLDRLWIALLRGGMATETYGKTIKLN